VRNDRFEIVYTQKFNISDRIDLIRDKETGVTYLRSWFNNTAGGIIAIIDEDGKPVVTK
jgi:hypothetical protein